MPFLHRNLPPAYDHHKDYHGNFQEFFAWAQELRDPLRKIPEVGDRLGYRSRVHPIGFIAVYLSPPNEGLRTMENTGLVRANIYPPGVELNEDIHCHGFDFTSGVVCGALVNKVYAMDWSLRAPDGEGYTGYESTVDGLGRNRTVRATDAVVVIPEPRIQELMAGETYSLRPRTDFHSVETHDGVVTIFGKTPTYPDQDGRSLVLRPPGDAPAPDEY